MVKTQIYLTREQYTALRETARKAGISVTELVRRLTQPLVERARRKRTKYPLADIIALTRKGPPDGSSNHDAYIGEDIAREHRIR